jgi:hypothetical protein
MNIRIGILLLTATVLGSCKMSTSPSSGNVPTTANTMYITVGGVTDTLKASAVDTTVNGVKGISIGGVGLAGVAVNIGIATISSTGTYKIGQVNISPAGYVILSYSKDTTGGLETYTSPTNPSLTSSSVGTLTITAISSSSVQATFNGTLTLQNGTATISITNGGVNANFVD